jgi:hypothetical protein
MDHAQDFPNRPGPDELIRADPELGVILLGHLAKTIADRVTGI